MLKNIIYRKLSALEIFLHLPKQPAQTHLGYIKISNAAQLNTSSHTVLKNMQLQFGTLLIKYLELVQNQAIRFIGVQEA